MVKAIFDGIDNNTIHGKILLKRQGKEILQQVLEEMGARYKCVPIESRGFKQLIGPYCVVESKQVGGLYDIKIHCDY